MTALSASFAAFARLHEALAATARKLEKRARIAEYLRPLAVVDAGRAALYLAGAPFPETDPRRLNVGGSLLGKAILKVAGTDNAGLHAAYRRHGDLGAAAEDLLTARAAGQEEPSDGLTLAEVAAAFDRIAAARGPAAKLPFVLGLLGRATPVEAKYLIKLMLGDMRTGVQQSLVEEALAAAYETEVAKVRHALTLNGSLPEVVALAAARRLDEARMQLFHPLGFMLASPVASVGEAMARFAQEIAAEIGQETAAEALPEQGDEGAGAPALREAQIEDKFDGIRAQLHCGDPGQPGRVGIFSRNREDISASFPELLEAFAAVDEPAILDGEILAWQESEGSRPERALPFSALAQRFGRKRVTRQMREELPVVFMAFDLLYGEGKLLLEQPLSARREALERFVARADRAMLDGSRRPATLGQGMLFAEPDRLARLRLSSACRLVSAGQLEQAYLDARARGNEGVMLKARPSLYQPGRRGLAWLKLKRELATLDVVVTSAEYGHGRRAKVLSDYTFAVRDGDELKNVGKAYSGLTDAEIEEITRFLQAHTLEDFGSWRTVEPVLVLEVAFNNIMRSERHNSGFALRFPRIVRIRNDKPVEEIDTLARVEEIYQSQPDKR